MNYPLKRLLSLLMPYSAIRSTRQRLFHIKALRNKPTPALITDKQGCLQLNPGHLHKGQSKSLLLLFLPCHVATIPVAGAAGEVMCCSGDFNQVSACGLAELQVSPLGFCTIHCCQIGKAPPRLSHPISTEQLRRLNCKLVGTQLLKVRLCSIRISCFHLSLRENIKIKQ